MSKKELAERYGVSGRTLRKWLKHHNLDFGNRQILTPNEVRQIIERFGFWDEETDL